jgi:hypothetical protein
MMSPWLLIKRVGGGTPKNLWIPRPYLDCKILEVKLMEKIQSLRKGDIHDLMDALQEFRELEKMVEAKRGQ